MARAKKSTSQLEQLRAENRQLKADNQRLIDAMKSNPRNKKRNIGDIFRKSGVVVFVSLALVLLTVGNLLFWTGHTIINTDRYIASVGPIIKNPDVQKSLASYTTNQIFDNFDVEGLTEQVLPPRADFLAPQLTSQLKSGTDSALQKVLAKPKFQDAWVNIQTRQHEKIIGFVRDYHGNGQISLNDIFKQAAGNLQGTKLAFLSNKELPDKVGNITVVNATWLPTAHKIVTHIDTWRLLTILLMLIFLSLAIYLSRRRRRVVYIFSWGTVLMMLATIISLRVAREIIASKADSQYTEGVRAAVQIFFHPLVIQSFLILMIGLLIASIAWLSSPSRSSVKFKGYMQDLLAGKLHQTLFGDRQSVFLKWVEIHKRLLEWLSVAFISLIMLIVRLTPLSLLLYSLLLLALVALIEVVGGASEGNRKVIR